MKKVIIILIVMTLLLFWTVEHKPGGSFDYYLLLKPYPTLDLFLGGGEEGHYARRIANGEFPDWLVNEQYIKLAWGSWEDNTKPWEYLRIGTLMVVFLGWPILFIIWSGLAAKTHLTRRSSKTP
ncbi:hypothetical protein [Pseudoalteromonas gelatinilytica]|uniref:hypothetical protein n=1 Tax=Pseudoalteromonas gelatinilytica TaxID=1703256 RepID=UPI0007C59811|nr:hypothetical protein [Pseudoalteromonas gelatinilytica]